MISNEDLTIVISIENYSILKYRYIYRVCTPDRCDVAVKQEEKRYSRKRKDFSKEASKL